jgi:hypothetical protein
MNLGELVAPYFLHRGIFEERLYGAERRHRVQDALGRLVQVAASGKATMHGPLAVRNAVLGVVMSSQ